MRYLQKENGYDRQNENWRKGERGLGVQKLWEEKGYYRLVWIFRYAGKNQAFCSDERDCGG